MTDRNEVASALGITLPDSTEMTANISAWAAAYEGRPYYLSDIIPSSLQLAYSAAHETARLTTLEFKSEISDTSPLHELWSDIIAAAPTYTEYAAALGGVMLKPYYNGRDIIVEHVRADSFFPTAYDDDGHIVGCVFVQCLQRGRLKYTKLEYHRFEDGAYKISNRAFRSESAVHIGSEISLDMLPEWSQISPEIEISNITVPLYAYFRMPGANSIDDNCPLGSSVYARAMDKFHDADEQYSRLLWEAKATEPAVFADVTMLRPDKKDKRKKLSRLSNRLFKLLDMGDSESLKEYAPQIRDTSQINILNTILRRAEYLCGLAYGTFSDINSVDKTATEIKASKQRSYATVSAIQSELEKALKTLAEVLTELCALYSIPCGRIEPSFEFDDSLIVDAESEQRILLQEVSAGLVSPVFYLMRRYGVTEEKALEMLPDSFGDDT